MAKKETQQQPPEILKQELSSTETQELQNRRNLLVMNYSNYISSEAFVQFYLMELARKYGLDAKKVVVENGVIYERKD